MYLINPVARCISKDQIISKGYYVAKYLVVTFTSGLPGGNRNNNGEFNNLGSVGVWWSSSESNAFQAWILNLDDFSGGVSRYNYDKEDGLSVRCLKD